MYRTVNNAFQVVVPQTLRKRELTAGHDGHLAGHPGARGLFYTLGHPFYLTFFVFHACATVRHYVACVKSRIRLRKSPSTLKLFTAKTLLEFVSIDMLGERIATERDNRYLLMITDRLYKLVRFVSMERIEALDITRVFFHHWLFSHDP